MTLIDNLKSLAEESDEYFTKRSEGIIPHLPKQLQEEARKVLGGIFIPEVRAEAVVFIPISHDTCSIFYDSLEILKRIFREGDLIVNGELDSMSHEAENIINSRQGTFEKLFYYGIFSEAEFNEISKKLQDQSHLDASERAIIEYLQINKHAKAVGLDSEAGEIIATALEKKPEIVKDDPDGSFSNELKYRVGIEGRTRFCLNHSSKISGVKRLIFFQGMMHTEGVRSWCNKYAIELKIIVPKSIKNNFNSFK